MRTPVSHHPNRRTRDASRRPGARTLRGQRGVAVVELSLIAPILAVVVFAAIDFGRLAQYQNRMSSAAREGAMIAQRHPGSFATGCRGDRNVQDRVRLQEPELLAVEGYELTYEAWDDVADAWVRYTGCDRAGTLDPAALPAPGDRVRVTVRADISMTGPITVFAGSDGSVELERRVEVVVQG